VLHLRLQKQVLRRPRGRPAALLAKFTRYLVAVDRPGEVSEKRLAARLPSAVEFGGAKGKRVKVDKDLVSRATGPSFVAANCSAVV
jgi:hypothetical protein